MQGEMKPCSRSQAAFKMRNEAMPDHIIILGAGGHAKVVTDIVLSSGNTVVGFLDDKATGKVLGFPVLGTLEDLSKYEGRCSFVIGIGDNKIRKQIAARYSVHWHTAIHPSAVIARDVVIGEGTVIMAGTIINPSTAVGKHCIINTGAVIEHDNMIADYAHISPNATLCGTVSVGESTHIGAGAVIKNNISICGGCVVGAGAVVVNNINKAGLYIGVPAKMR